MNRQQLLGKLDRAWSELRDSYAGLPESRMLDVGVTSQWSVRDVLAHVTWWDEEALKHLPGIAKGVRPPRYSVTYGGIDAFNARMTEERRSLALAEVIALMDDVHGRLVRYVESTPHELYERETPWRHRLRLDTYGHYPLHAKAIREWRTRSGL